MGKSDASKTSPRAGKPRNQRPKASAAQEPAARRKPPGSVGFAEFMRDRGVQAIIFAPVLSYLKAKNNDLKIPAQWFADLAQPIGSTADRRGAHLQWLLPPSPGGRARSRPVDPGSSFGYVRTGSDGSTGTLGVLLASLVWQESMPRKKTPLRLAGGQGVRVVIRIRPIPKPPGIEVIVEAASASLPAVPDEDVRVWNEVLKDSDVAYLLGKPPEPGWPARVGLDPALYDTYSVGLRLEDPEDGMGGVPSSRFLARLVPQRVTDTRNVAPHVLDAPAYAVEAVVRSGAGKTPHLEGLQRYPLFAQLRGKVYTQDPPTQRGSLVLFPKRPAGVPSGRPSRSWLDLDQFRVAASLGTLPGAGAGRSKLEDPKGRFFVAQSRHVEGGGAGFDENAPAVIASATHSVRTDGFAAVNAYLRALDFFTRLDDWYGLPLDTHFAFAKLPLIVRYRAGVVPGAGDGRTINAQVRWAPTPASTFPANLEMRLALADLQSNEGRVSAVHRTGKVKRAPLSIAAAPRWCWHEFGHVLIAGATGELELDLAHSVGDALGAILCDPRSELAKESTHPGWRGVTFPWQSLPHRRHDHEAADGWSWSGVHARPSRHFAGADGHHALNRGGYCSEQLMSSSLFRFYRALGGDTETAAGVADEARRTVAAEHAVALIMAAIGILGPRSATALRSAEDFAGALKAADSTMPPLTIGGGTRYGGMAHKVARWAFEQQGAFPPPGSAPWSHNAPGMAPATDVFIASARGGEHGGYAPVTFADGGHLAPRAVLWVRRAPSGTTHEDPQGGADNYVFVRVGNRGQADAKGATVRVWRARLTTSGRIPKWTNAKWVELAPHQAGAAGPKDVPAGTAGVRFGPFRWTGAKSGARYALLVAATCDTDRSNLDPVVALPCATAPCSVAELAAFDNNLGLTHVRAV